MDTETKLKLTSMLIDAVISNDAEAVIALLKNGADPNAVEDHDNITPLHHAAQNNSIEAAMALIKGGARIDSIMEGGNTPLDIAELFDHKEMVKLLTAGLFA